MAEVQCTRGVSSCSRSDYGHQSNPNLAAALHYAERGFRIVPLWPMHNGRCECAKGASCEAAGKHSPLKGWQRLASSDPRELRRWWAKWPSAGVGAVLDGETFVLDIDPRNTGDESFAALVREHGELPATLTHRSGGGGLHYFLRAPFVVPNADGVVAGVDVLGRGHLVVLPPSNHRSGERYSVEKESEIAAAPEWVLDIVSTSPKRTASNAHHVSGHGRSLRSLAGKKTDGFHPPFSESEKKERVPQGRRRSTLLSELGQLWNRATFSEADAYDHAESYTRTRCETGTEPFSISEARACAEFIVGLPKRSTSTAPGLEVMTDTRHQVAELLRLAERVNWRALAEKWGTTRRGNPLRRPSDITRTANTLRHVYTRTLSLAYQRDTMTPAVAVRELAERARCDKETASRHLRTIRLAGLLRLAESWDRRTRQSEGTAALANAYTLTPATVAEKVCPIRTASPSGTGGVALCTYRANFPAWLLSIRALGPHAPRALAVLEAGEVASGRALGRALGLSDAPASRLLCRLEAYGLAERVGKRGWRRGPAAVAELVEHRDERLEAARRAAENQRRAHQADRAAMQWTRRLAARTGEKPPKLVLRAGRPETTGNGCARGRRSDERRPGRPSAWGKIEASRDAGDEHQDQGDGVEPARTDR